MDVTFTSLADETLQITVQGDMDAYGCRVIQPKLEKIITALPLPNIIMDLKEVQFLDSSGIGSIVFLFKRLKAANRVLKLININSQPYELITLLRLNQAMSVEPISKTG